ncbi:peptidoglycan-binding protein [Kribbella sp. NBC_01505]|uniref:peptidoglycan-binding protein n=1 Tax=Kribbella sp. NBC_01505 TaxID=2903580 RepID=UPI00386D3185
MDARTRDMLVEARRICEAPLVITQGGYNKGGVEASAGTHDGGGALDIRITNLTKAQIAEAVRRLRQVGFAAWHRTPAQGNWVGHIHCIAVGCKSLSAGARAQAVAYKNGKNGLKNNRKDDGDQLYVHNTWESYRASLKPGKPLGARVSLKLIDYAAKGGYYHSGQKVALEVASVVVRWLGRIKVASARDIRVWEQLVRAAQASDRKADWKKAGAQYTGIVRRFQVRYGLTPDGVVGPATKAKFSQLLSHHGFRVVA